MTDNAATAEALLDTYDVYNLQKMAGLAGTSVGKKAHELFYNAVLMASEAVTMNRRGYPARILIKTVDYDRMTVPFNFESLKKQVSGRPPGDTQYSLKLPQPLPPSIRVGLDNIRQGLGLTKDSEAVSFSLAFVADVAAALQHNCGRTRLVFGNSFDSRYYVAQTSFDKSLSGTFQRAKNRIEGTMDTISNRLFAKPATPRP